MHVLYALEDPTAGWTPYDSDEDTASKQREQLYLDATAKWLSTMACVPVMASVLPGSAVIPESVADGILLRAKASGTDLIVMATHGHGPLGRLGPGSVANELIRRACVPILLVRPRAEGPRLIPEPLVENVLIPLDGSALAEYVLQPALDLARMGEACCTLLRVVDSDFVSADHVLPDATEYLERVAGRIRGQGLPVQIRVAVASDATEGILEAAKAEGSELIALATHGRGGLKRLLLGSVAKKLVRNTSLPVLVCPPASKQPG